MGFPSIFDPASAVGDPHGRTVSIIETDTEAHREWKRLKAEGFDITVTLNRLPVLDAVAADEVTGTVQRYRKKPVPPGLGERYVLTHDNKALATEVVYGRVRIHLSEPPLPRMATIR